MNDGVRNANISCSIMFIQIAKEMLHSFSCLKCIWYPYSFELQKLFETFQTAREQQFLSAPNTEKNSSSSYSSSNLSFLKIDITN